MTVRVVFFADTHLGFDYPARPRVDRRRRGPDFFASYHRVLEHILRVRPDLVVHGGDVFARRRVPPSVVDLAYEPLVRLAAEGIPVVIVPGNHEGSRLPESLWLNVPGIHVFRRPATFTFSVRGATVAVAGFPFVRRARDAFSSSLDATGWRDIPADIHLLCLHQTLEGATVGPRGYTFRSGREVIPWRDLPRELPLVLSGHIHRRQVLTRESWRRVIYPGSTERTSFAEKDETKGFYDLRVDGRRGHLASSRFVSLVARPMFDLYLGGSSSGLRSEIEAGVADLDADAIVRIQWRGGDPEEARRTLSASFLRSVLPDTMNVQLAFELRRPREVPS